MPTTYTDNSVGKTGLPIPDRYNDEIWTPWSDMAYLLNRLTGGFLAIPQGDANYTLKDTGADRESRTLALKFTTTLTAAREIKIDTTTSGKYSGRPFIIWNASSGAFKLTIKTTAGGSTGPDVNQGKIRAVFHDGTNVYPIGPEVDATTFAIAGSSFGNQTANHVFAGPASGGAAAPAFRALVTGDLPAAVAAHVYNDANLSIADSTLTTLTFNQERYDSNTIHSTSSNTDRLTFPYAGKWRIGARARYAANATGVRGVLLYLNGSTIIGYDLRLPAGASPAIMSVETEWSVAANDHAIAKAYQTSGGSLNVEVDDSYSPDFWCSYLGA